MLAGLLARMTGGMGAMGAPPRDYREERAMDGERALAGEDWKEARFKEDLASREAQEAQERAMDVKADREGWAQATAEGALGLPLNKQPSMMIDVHLQQVMGGAAHPTAPVRLLANPQCGGRCKGPRGECVGVEWGWAQWEPQGWATRVCGGCHF